MDDFIIYPHLLDKAVESPRGRRRKVEGSEMQSLPGSSMSPCRCKKRQADREGCDQCSCQAMLWMVRDGTREAWTNGFVSRSPPDSVSSHIVVKDDEWQGSEKA